MTDEDKIIQLFHSGQYELAYTLRESLNVEMDYSKIDLVEMVHKLSNCNTLHIPNKNNVLTIEIEINRYNNSLDWIELMHYSRDLLLAQHEILRKKYYVIPKVKNDHNYKGLTFFFYKDYHHEEDVSKLLKYIFEYG